MAHFSPSDLVASTLAPVYLVVAAVSLLMAVRYLKRVMAPVGELVHVVAAAIAGVLAVSLALILVFAALLTMLRG